MSKCIRGLVLILFLPYGQAMADGPTKVLTEARAVEQVLYAYEDAWSRHDAPAIAGFYYEPAMRISPNGPIVRATRAAQEEFFNVLLPELVKEGYSKSVWDHLEVRLLDDNTAIASGVVTRYRANGSVFQRQGVTYGLWRTDRGWKIFLSKTHAPTAALHFR